VVKLESQRDREIVAKLERKRDGHTER